MQAPGTDPPPADVRRAFGAEGTPEPLGGFTGAWRVGPLVLKRAHAEPAALECEAEVLASVPDAGFRLQRLRHAAEGSTIVDGWIARDFLDGRHELGRWREILRVGDALHDALRIVTRADAAPMVEGRSDPWARADRMAWGEEPIPAGATADPVPRLAAARRAISTPAQLVHGDLTGNVLFADGAPPAVIDFSPYVRAPAYALGVVIADAVVWQGASLDLLAPLAGRPGMGQCLIRALLFRHLTALLLERRVPFGAAAERYEALVRAAISLA